MTFAHWKNIAPPAGVVTGPGSEHSREVGRDEVAERFILNIPEGTQRGDVVARLVGSLLASGRCVEETDGLGFEEEWPQEVRRQFNYGRGDRWLWDGSEMSPAGTPPTTGAVAPALWGKLGGEP
jgi:hypothetical protein